MKRPIRYERKYGHTLVPCIVAPIIVDGQLFGNITCWAVNNDHVAMDLAILEKASSLLSLEFLKLKLKYDMEQQYKNDFMRELIFNESISDQNIIEWGLKYQLSIEQRYVCMLVGERIDNQNNIHQVIEKSEISTLLVEDYPQMLLGTIRNKFCLIIPTDEVDERNICEDIYQKLRNHTAIHIDLYAGVGEVYEGPKGIRKSFSQAEQAFKLKKTDQSSGGIVYYKDLGAYRLLGSIIESQQLTDFYEETIGILLKEDPKKELIQTLKAYFQHNETVKRTSEKLFIHVNTLKYRIKRIEQITGLNLKKTDDKVNLYLGLKIYELRNYHKE